MDASQAPERIEEWQKSIESSRSYISDSSEDEDMLEDRSSILQSQPTGENEEEDRWDDDFELIVLTSGTPPLMTKTITHVGILPDYPQTSIQGYTFVVHIGREKATLEQARAEGDSMQYCRRLKGPVKSTFSPFFESSALRIRSVCTGIKRCEHLDNGLATFSHTHVNEETWEHMRNARLDAYRGEADPCKRKSTSWYTAIMHRFRGGVFCPTQGPSCSPVIRQSRTMTLSGAPVFYIGCQAYEGPHTQNKHYFKRISDQYSVLHLQHLFATGLVTTQGPQDTCAVILPTTTKLSNCDVDHPQGHGKLEKQPCKVEFNILIPTNLVDNPFFLFTSHGIHSHPPPPPTKLPNVIACELLELIRRVRDPSMTCASFLRGPFMDSLCQKYSVVSFGQIHATLNNLDRLRALIYKEKLNMFPSGQDLAGVQFEMEMRHKNIETAYIREIHHSELGTLILTMRKEQAITLAGVNSFQVDVSFQRNREPWQELIIAYFNEQHGKLFTLARIYMNTKRRRLYSQAFQILFKWVERLSGQPIRWRHINQTGYIGITADMDGAQFGGFGRYLRHIDPFKRPWRYHLAHTVRFCSQHFKRGIERVASGFTPPDPDTVQRMWSIIHAPSYEQYSSILEELERDSRATVQNWARHKHTTTFACGLNRYISKMSRDDWYRLENTSNHVEQTGKKSYSYGKNMNLLPAILMALKLDSRDIDQQIARNEMGLRHGYSKTSSSAREGRKMQRENHKRKRQLILQADDSASDDEERFMGRASSTGVVKPRTASRSRNTASNLSSRGPSSSPASEPSQPLVTGPQPVALPIRAPSTEGSLQRQAVHHNMDLEARRIELELRERAAAIKQKELMNEKLELEIEAMRRGSVPPQNM